jgi:hypothetical protein
MPSMIKELCTDEVIPKGIKAFADQALQNLAEAHDTMIKARVFQTRNTNTHQREEHTISPGDLVYLSTKKLESTKRKSKETLPKVHRTIQGSKSRPGQLNVHIGVAWSTAGTKNHSQVLCITTETIHSILRHYVSE